MAGRPEDIYAAFTNPFAIELWSGFPASMSTEAGSEFELWEGDICGRNLEFEENSMIVQEWYFGDSSDPSIVTIKLFRQGGKTQVEVNHTNIPENDFENIRSGWLENYLGAIKEFVEGE